MSGAVVIMLGPGRSSSGASHAHVPVGRGTTTDRRGPRTVDRRSLTVGLRHVVVYSVCIWVGGG
jgi:hypothetical protein